MSFQKRKVTLSSPSSSIQRSHSDASSIPAPGVRASPLDGRLTTSTGTSSLDDLLGHSGFALGNSLLLEENGTTEFSTTLLRYFAAEGVVQGHKVHIVGAGETWIRELPDVSTPTGGHTESSSVPAASAAERMKIAWRYERLGEFGTGLSRARGLTRWIELLSDGVIEISPFPPSMETNMPMTTSGGATTREERPQGMVKVHRLPVFSDRGGGDTSGDDLTFTVSRRKFVIKPFNLPPVAGDTEAQQGKGDGKPAKVDIEF
ncbi:MAG: hypothetical protein Q9219_005577 [cf. Caloplaca sp. 3 TL-2023]